MNFQVTLEEFPCEAFTNVSAEKCWEMVLQRLNQEIIRHGSIGERGLPSLHALQSVNGLEMFGFLSPPIIQVKLPSFILNCIYSSCLWDKTESPTLNLDYISILAKLKDGGFILWISWTRLSCPSYMACLLAFTSWFISKLRNTSVKQMNQLNFHTPWKTFKCLKDTWTSLSNYALTTMLLLSLNILKFGKKA